MGLIDRRPRGRAPRHPFVPGRVGSGAARSASWGGAGMGKTVVWQAGVQHARARRSRSSWRARPRRRRRCRSRAWVTCSGRCSTSSHPGFPRPSGTRWTWRCCGRRCWARPPTLRSVATATLTAIRLLAEDAARARGRRRPAVAGTGHGGGGGRSPAAVCRASPWDFSRRRGSSRPGPSRRGPPTRWPPPSTSGPCRRARSTRWSASDSGGPSRGTR